MAVDACALFQAFHNPQSNAFVVEPQYVDRVSIVSSSNVVRAMLTNEEGWARVGRTDLDLGGLLKALLDAPWDFDPLQTPVALSAIVALNAGLPSHPKAHLALAHTCLSLFRNAAMDAADLHVGTAGVVDEQSAAGMPLARAALISGREELGVDAFVPGENGRPPASSYLRYQCSHALVELVTRVGWQPAGDAWLAPRMGEVRAALERAAIDAYRSITEQMALRAARADEGSDPIRLSFDLCTYYEASSALTVSGTFFQKATRAPKVNLKLTAHVLRAIFALQKESGLWPKGEPIAARLSSRDLGNSFVFSFDLVDALLQTIGESQPALFREHLGSLELMVGWAESSILQSAGTAAWYAARPEGTANALTSDEIPAGVTRGWRSNHLSENGGPLCWSSAQVCSALSSMRCLLRKLSAEDVLSEFRATRIGEKSARLFDSLMDSEVQLASGASDALGIGSLQGSANGGHAKEGNSKDDTSASLKRILTHTILEPLADAPQGRRPLEGRGPKKDAKFSAILCALPLPPPRPLQCHSTCILHPPRHEHARASEPVAWHGPTCAAPLCTRMLSRSSSPNRLLSALRAPAQMGHPAPPSRQSARRLRARWAGRCSPSTQRTSWQMASSRWRVE